VRRRVFLLAGSGTTVGVSAKAQKAAARLGELAPSFSVPDAFGRVRSWGEFKALPVVLEWSSASCPFAAAQYVSGRMPDLQRWARDKGAAWLTVLSSHPSRSDYLPGGKAQAFNAKRGGVPTALMIDGSGAMGRTYGAVTANHMFVIAADGRLVYAGGIDDSESADVAVVRRSRNHVRAALDDLSTGRPVAAPEMPPFGCTLAYAG
jgi:hypothetical protein